MAVRRFIRLPDQVEVVTSEDPIHDIHRLAPDILVNGKGQLFRYDDRYGGDLNEVDKDMGEKQVMCWWRKVGEKEVHHEPYSDFLKRYVAEKEVCDVHWPIES